MSNQIEFQERHSAFQKRLRTIAIVNLGHIDVWEFLNDAFHYFQLEMYRILSEQNMIKLNACLKLIFEKMNVTAEGEESVESQTIYIQTNTHTLDGTTNLRGFYDKMIAAHTLERIDDVVTRGSGFALSKIEEIAVQVNRYEPIVGSSFIDLPKFLKTKKAIINVQNDDDQCFRYAVLSALYPSDNHAHLVSTYRQHIDKLNFNGITFPMDPKQISHFGKENPDISINVYVFDKDDVKIRTLRLTKSVKTKPIHLLLLHQKEKRHYCWIKSLSRLLNSQSSRNTKKKYFCDRCLNYFNEVANLKEHTMECSIRNECVIELPTKKECKIKFENHKKQLNG